MATVGLITTGECEHRALGRSLQRVFGDELEIVSPFRMPVPSITSNYLGYPGPSIGNTAIDKLADSIVATLDSRGAPDYVFVVDDLELPNIATPHHVTQLVSDAIVRKRGPSPTHRTVERVQQRCSFHLLCPMLEAYFFGEPAALQRAGAVRSPQLEPTRSLEQFLATDPDFLTPEDVRDHRWRQPQRAAHPKQYVNYLVDPSDSGERRYRETRHGASALATLDWHQVFHYEPAGTAFAAALFDDLADALGVRVPLRLATPHPLTARRSHGTLRNLA